MLPVNGNTNATSEIINVQSDEDHAVKVTARFSKTKYDDISKSTLSRLNVSSRMNYNTFDAY